MKKVFLFLACVLLLGISCTEQSTELIDEQIATIISEVEEQYTEGISNLSTLDMQVWSQPWSKENFISVFSGVNYYSTLNEFIDSVTYYFSLRESQDVQIVDMNTTVLSSDLALLTSITNWDILYKSEEHIIYDGVLATLLWKKEESVWKIICLHESWQENNEE